ncbi:MAG: DUF3703 domain-containing protein [Chitinophagaceae bacterium]|nr:MAG: DUF3703 domain-containing protein [Chitinophagaceae bacterium]
MKFKTRAPKSLRSYLSLELVMSKEALKDKKYTESWRHLERAHILGQPYPLAHTLVHWKMLQFAVEIKNAKEIIGQLPRLLVGGVKSFIGVIPIGNTGGANVPALKPMEIPADLAEIIDQHTR